MGSQVQLQGGVHLVPPPCANLVEGCPGAIKVFLHPGAPLSNSQAPFGKGILLGWWAREGVPECVLGLLGRGEAW